MSQAPPPQLFISYAHRDRSLKKELVLHLAGLRERGVITTWHDGLLVPGQQWDEEIVKQLDASRVVLLLISPDFIASDYITKVELERTSTRHARGEVVVIPVLLRHVHDWQSKRFGRHTLGDFQALPSDFRFIKGRSNRDPAFASVAEGIEKAVKGLKQLPAPDALPRVPRPPSFGFVARHDAAGDNLLELLARELAPGRNQVVTLSGPGGVGKTTLAAEAARTLAQAYDDRIVWTSAEGRTSYELSTLLDDIATQLDHADLRRRALAERAEAVRALVASPQTLVVLDNYETVADAARPALERWLNETPCCALITSRTKVAGTRFVNVSVMSPKETEEFLENFITRETQAPEMFTPEIRRRISATAGANPYVMQWVVGQIDDAREPQTVLDELAQGKGDAAARVFERSFCLLDEDASAALLALSLFVPSASRRSLAEVAGLDTDTPHADRALTRLHALWLIKGLDAHSRFTLEGLTRTHARARLANDPRAPAIRQRFIAHFLTYAATHPQPTPEDLNSLEAERDNLLAAMDVAFESQDWQSVTDIGLVLGEFLGLHGHWDEAIQHGEQALEAARKLGQETDIAALTHNLAITYQERGELEKARRLYDESMEIKKRLGHQSGIANTLHQLAMLAQYRGEYEEARRLCGESMEIKRRLGNQSGIAKTLHQLAVLAQERGEYQEARRLYDESMEIKKRLGDQSGIASTLHQLAMLAEDRGEYEEARRLYDESMEIKKRLGDKSGIAYTLHQLAMLAQDRGEYEEARRLYDESMEITKRLGDQRGIASTFGQMGRLAEIEGNKIEAARLYRAALDIFERLKSPYAKIAREDLETVEKNLERGE